jgi:hypothetical protein
VCGGGGGEGAHAGGGLMDDHPVLRPSTFLREGMTVAGRGFVPTHLLAMPRALPFANWPLIFARAARSPVIGDR